MRLRFLLFVCSLVLIQIFYFECKNMHKDDKREEEFDYEKALKLIQENGDKYEPLFSRYYQEKRFLSSLLNKLFRKTKTTATSETPTTTTTTSTLSSATPAYEYYLAETEAQENFRPTTKTTKSSSLSTMRTIPIIFVTSRQIGSTEMQSIGHENWTVATSDVFYKLKHHCSKNYDSLCITKRLEFVDLLQKCDTIKMSSSRNASQLNACRQVFSVYCFIYSALDLYRCRDGSKYDRYDANQHKTTNVPSPSTRLSSTSTAKYSHWRLVNYTSSTSSSTTRSSKNSLTLNLADPFDGEPVDSIPKSSEKLKQIGAYCMKQRARHSKCERMLQLLKEKFKQCELAAKSNADCQSFKMEFCTAFTSFTCCADVLAGRTCNGKPV